MKSIISHSLIFSLDLSNLSICSGLIQLMSLYDGRGIWSFMTNASRPERIILRIANIRIGQKASPEDTVYKNFWRSLAARPSEIKQVSRAGLCARP